MNPTDSVDRKKIEGERVRGYEGEQVEIGRK